MRAMLALAATLMVTPATGQTLDATDPEAVAIWVYRAEQDCENITMNLAAATHEADWAPHLTGIEAIVNAAGLLRGRAMGNVLVVSDIVLSQAGTATTQALGLGKPVIYMTSPKDRQSRFEDEQRLYGEARIAVPGEAGAIAKALERLIDSPDERARLGAIGRERIGGAGAIDEVLAALGS